MGADAYALVSSLYNGDRAAWPVRGMSGDLTLEDTGKIHRTLPLAQFRNGRPVAYEAEPVGGSTPSELVGTR